MTQFNLDDMYCGAIRRGDVFISEVQGRDDGAVVVLQDNVLNQGLPTVVCASIEPYTKNERVFVNEVLLKNHETGLGVDGLCRLYDIKTIDRRAMRVKKSELSNERMGEIFVALDTTLGRFRDR